MIAVASIAAGIQFGWALQLSLLTPYVQLFGVPYKWDANIWLCGPISGMIIQPLVRYYSDKCTSRFGRRRPFIFSGALKTSGSSTREPNPLSKMIAVASIAAGIQFGWALQLSLLTPYVRLLGVPYKWAANIWLCGPISGMIIQPLVRSRPFIFSDAIAVAIAVFLIGYAADLGHAFGDDIKPKQTRPRAVAMTVVISKAAEHDRNVRGVAAVGHPSDGVKAGAFIFLGVLGILLAITFSVPFALASIYSSTSGAGQGLSLGVLNIAIVVPQIFVTAVKSSTSDVIWHKEEFISGWHPSPYKPVL